MAKKQRGERKPKKFVENKEVALNLATSVAETQESKTQQKVERHNELAKTATSSPAPTSKQKHRGANGRLKQIKEALSAKAVQAKKEKTKARKQKKATTEQPKTKHNTIASSDKTGKPRKRVSFA